jgi:hypothetical protein
MAQIFHVACFSGAGDYSLQIFWELWRLSRVEVTFLNAGVERLMMPFQAPRCTGDPMNPKSFINMQHQFTGEKQ